MPWKIRCTEEELKSYRLIFGRGLGKTVRHLLDKQMTQGKILSIPIRPPIKQHTKSFKIKCNESELWNWRMLAPPAQRKGTRTWLRAIVCDLLNKEIVRRRK